MDNKEIGSEFPKHALGNGQGLVLTHTVTDSLLVFSGRTAIETVLLSNPLLRSAALPSYCCDSIIEPFRKHNIKIQFYDVYFKNSICIDLPDLKDVDLVFWIQYFGFNSEMPDFSRFKSQGGIVVEDITHSLFSLNQVHSQSDYYIASLRKWDSLVCGGYCGAVNNFFTYAPIKKPPKEFVELKNSAMALKSEYLKDSDHAKKNIFLNEYKQCNSWLAANYSGYTIDDFSREYLEHINYEEERSIRINNAKVLYNGLKNHPFITPMFKMDEMDCPLFVPVLIKNGYRDYVRKVLTQNHVYCPIHWPHPNAPCNSNLYDSEISLICDQRYRETDMQRIVEILCSDLLNEELKQ